jgi:hypothetical protein
MARTLSDFIHFRTTIFGVGRHVVRKRALALVLGALFIGLAPLVHAFCVEPMVAPGGAATAIVAQTMTHTMADDSTMVMTVAGDMAAQAETTMTSDAEKASVSHASAPSLVGSILVAVGLAILTFFGIRRCAQQRAQVENRGRAGPAPRARWPKIIRLQPSGVNLNSLGISRI